MKQREKRSRLLKNSKNLQKLFDKVFPSYDYNKRQLLINRIDAKSRKIVHYELGPAEIGMQDFLLKHKIKANKAYYLLRIANLPKEIKYAYMKGKLSLKQAFEEYNKVSKVRCSPELESLKREILEVINKLYDE